MARRGRPTVQITLSTEERTTLQRWARRHSSSQALALRCRIVLACAEGTRTHAEIAAELGCNPVTVSTWRHRFAADRLDELVDAPRRGAARTIGDDVVEAIVVETLETAPPDATHWSTRGLAARHGISHTTVGEIWRAFGPRATHDYERNGTCDLFAALQRFAGRSVKELATNIQAWAANWNENSTPFTWHKTAEEILERVTGYCVAINQAADT